MGLFKNIGRHAKPSERHVPQHSGGKKEKYVKGESCDTCGDSGTIPFRDLKGNLWDQRCPTCKGKSRS